MFIRLLQIFIKLKFQIYIMILKNFKLLFSFCVIMFLTSTAFGAIEIFSQYDTKIKINSDDTIDISKDITLQNIHIVGIVPGRVEFKIGKVVQGSSSQIKLESYTIKDKHGNPIQSQLFETETDVIIAIDIYLPLLPGFKYPIDLDYTLSYDSSGILFKSLEFPIREDTSIEIRQGTFSLEIPESKSFTYLEIYDTDVTINNSIATWDIDSKSPSTGIVEYSSVPIYYGGIQGSILFWMIINILLLIILVIEIVRGIRKMKKED